MTNRLAPWWVCVVGVCVSIALPRAVQAAEVTREYTDVAISPDGMLLATIEEVRADSTDADGGPTTVPLRTNLIIANITGSDAVVVDSVPSCTGELSDVSWSPDSTVLTYVRVRVNTNMGSTWETPEYRVRMLNANGSYGKTLVRSADKVTGPVFTHDGAGVIYDHWDKDGNRSLRKIGVDGTGDTEIVRKELDAGRPRRLERGDFFLFSSAAINADGTLNPAETRRVICGVKADGTGLAQVMTWPNQDRVFLQDTAVSADGSRLVVRGMNGFIVGDAWQTMGIAQESGELRSPAVRGVCSMAPDGSYTVFCGGMAVANGLVKVPLKGEPTPITLQRVNPDDAARLFMEEDGENEEGGAPEDAASRRFGDIAISPDGTLLVFSWELLGADGAVATSELWSMHADGTGLQQLTSGQIDGSPRFGPIGVLAAFTREVKTDAGVQHDIYSANAWSGTVVPVVQSEHDETQPSYGASEDTLMFRRSPAGKPGDHWIVQLAGGVEKDLVEPMFDPSSPTYVPAVDACFFSSKAIDAQGNVADGKRHLGVVSSTLPNPASWRSSNGTPVDLMEFRSSSNGSRLLTVMRAEDRDHLFFEEAGLTSTMSGDLSRITFLRSFDLALNGSRFVFVGRTAEDAADSAPGMWLVEWNAGTFTRLTPGTRAPGLTLKPAATLPVIAAESDAREEPVSAEQVSATGRRTQVTWPCFSPDGARLLAVEELLKGDAEDPTLTTLVSAKLDGTDVKELVEGGDIYRPRYNADGSKIVFEMRAAGEGDSEVYVCDADGSNLTQLTTNEVSDGEACFTPTGDGVFFVRRADFQGAGEMFRTDLKGQGEHVVLGKEFDPANPVTWGTSAVVTRMKPISTEGVLQEGAPGWIIGTHYGEDQTTQVFLYDGSKDSRWPQSIRMATGKTTYCVRIASGLTGTGLLLFIDETVSTTSGSVVPQCVLGSDEWDLSADGKTIAFFGMRNQIDPDELPGLWIMGTDGKDARLFMLKR